MPIGLGISREDLEKLYKSMSDEEIARLYGYSPKYIAKLRLMHGLYKRGRRSRCLEISKEDLEKLYKSMDDEEIARIYGIPVSCIKHLRYRYRLLRRALCPEIPREIFEEMIDKSDHEIAMIYDTKKHCIASRRIRLGIRKRARKRVAVRGININVMRADSIEKLLLSKIEDEGVCYTTSKEIREKLHIYPRPDIWEELVKRGYRILRIWIGLKRQYMFIYKPGCEELIATKILMEILNQVERTKKRIDIDEVRKAVRSIIARYKPPTEIRKALRIVLSKFRAPSSP